MLRLQPEISRLEAWVVALCCAAEEATYTEMTAKDVERIVRDVLTTSGIAAILLHVESTDAGWYVTVRDQGHRNRRLRCAERSAIGGARYEQWVDGV